MYESSKKSFISEKTSTKPNSAYSKSKLKTERMLKALPCKVIILRFPSVISKKFQKGLIFRILIKLRKNQRLSIFNINSLFNNIVLLDEVNKIILKSIDIKTKKVLTINIAAKKPIKLFKVLKYLIKKTKSKSKIIIQKSKYNLKYYSTKLQDRIYKNQISNVENSLKKLF